MQRNTVKNGCAAIIGDLAAWTWEHDKDAFNKSLVSQDAKLSEYGATAIFTASSVFRNCDIDPINPWKFECFLPQTVRDGAPLSTDICKWVDSDRLDKNFPYEGVKKALVVVYGLTGWSDKSADEASKHARKIAINFEIKKQDFYATRSLPKLIWNLRQGMSKDEALNAIEPSIAKLTSNQSYRADDDPLGAVVRAWDAFYRSDSLTSAIHNAVKSPVNPHLTAAIAGELAEAMYGWDDEIGIPRYLFDRFEMQLESLGCQKPPFNYNGQTFDLLLNQGDSF